MMDDRRFMEMALDLAKKGEGFTSPNPMVGAVLVRDGEVVGTGYHKACGQAHAEVDAIRSAGERAAGATLYVTLEPCNHFGRTPPCTERILDAGIKRVVAAMADPNPNVPGGGIDFLRERGVEVTVGPCEAEAKRLNEAYIKFITIKRPFVLVKCAATLDGCIATRTGDSKWVSCEESRKYVHRLRHACDAILVGVNTVRTDNPALTTRIEGMRGKNPARIILDTRLSISEKARVLQPVPDSYTIVVSGNRPFEPFLAEKKARLEAMGVKMLPSGIKDNRIDLDFLMDRLGELGFMSILIEGGARVIASALAAGIVDKIALFYGPKIFGGDDGVPMCRGPGPETMNRCISVKDMDVRRMGTDVLIEGYIGAPPFSA